MTEVNRSNYQSLFPEIITKIQNCAFVSIDSEFTGLHSSDPKLRRSLFDTGSRRYEKVRDNFANNSNYLISQFGICIFNKESWDENNWSVDAYNVFLFPVAFGEHNQTKIFSCQVSSVNFLSEYNFDFNKFIREGAPYLRADEEISLRKYLTKNGSGSGDDDEELIKQLRGFTQILQTIHEYKKPLVAHNCFLDLVLILNQFLQPLPQEYYEFKKTITSFFPAIYDTKYVAIALENELIDSGLTMYFDYKTLSDTSLYELYKNILAVKDFISPVVEPIGGAIKYKDYLVNPGNENSENCQHEAGLDACLTGIIFLLLSHISLRKQTGWRLTLSNQGPTVKETFLNVVEWANRVPMMTGTVKWINLVGLDPNPYRPNWISFKIPGENDQYPSLEVLNNLVTTVLPMYGFIEFKVDQENNIMSIACAGKSTFERITEELEERGFDLKIIEIPRGEFTKPDTGTWNWGNKIFLVGIVVVGTLLFRRFSRR